MQWLIELVADLVRSELAVPKCIGFFGPGCPTWSPSQTYTVIPNVIDYDPNNMFEVDSIQLQNAAETFFYIVWNIHLYPSVGTGKYVLITVFLNDVETFRWVRYVGSAGQFTAHGSCFLRCSQYSSIKVKLFHNAAVGLLPFLSTRVSQVAVFGVL